MSYIYVSLDGCASITASWHEDVREDERGEEGALTSGKYSTDPWPVVDRHPQDGLWQVKEGVSLELSLSLTAEALASPQGAQRQFFLWSKHLRTTRRKTHVCCAPTANDCFQVCWTETAITTAMNKQSDPASGCWGWSSSVWVSIWIRWKDCCA